VKREKANVVSTKTKKQQAKYNLFAKHNLLPAGEYLYVFGEKGSNEPHSSTVVTAKKAHPPSLVAQQVSALLKEHELNPSTTWCRVTDKWLEVGVGVPWVGSTPTESAQFALEGKTFWQKHLAV
jgi:hypothetical protein